MSTIGQSSALCDRFQNFCMYVSSFLVTSIPTAQVFKLMLRLQQENVIIPYDNKTHTKMYNLEPVLAYKEESFTPKHENQQECAGMWWCWPMQLYEWYVHLLHRLRRRCLWKLQTRLLAVPREMHFHHIFACR